VEGPRGIIVTIDSFSAQIDADDGQGAELDASTQSSEGFVIPAYAASTAQDFSVSLGYLIVESQANGISIEDQILVLEIALDALRQAFIR
jgi:hypothetical protein